MLGGEEMGKTWVGGMGNVPVLGTVKVSSSSSSSSSDSLPYRRPPIVLAVLSCRVNPPFPPTALAPPPEAALYPPNEVTLYPGEVTVVGEPTLVELNPATLGEPTDGAELIWLERALLAAPEPLYSLASSSSSSVSSPSARLWRRERPMPTAPSASEVISRRSGGGDVRVVLKRREKVETIAEEKRNET